MVHDDELEDDVRVSIGRSHGLPEVHRRERSGRRSPDETLENRETVFAALPDAGIARLESLAVADAGTARLETPALAGAPGGERG